jgi:hypothetical protein
LRTPEVKTAANAKRVNVLVVGSAEARQVV